MHAFIPVHEDKNYVVLRIVILVIVATGSLRIANPIPSAKKRATFHSDQRTTKEPEACQIGRQKGVRKAGLSEMTKVARPMPIHS